MIPAGRRKLVRGEHLFIGTPHGRGRMRRHLWMAQTGRFGTVVACSVCGKIRQGETMPERHEPLLR